VEDNRCGCHAAGQTLGNNDDEALNALATTFTAIDRNMTSRCLQRLGGSVAARNQTDADDSDTNLTCTRHCSHIHAPSYKPSCGQLLLLMHTSCCLMIVQCTRIATARKASFKIETFQKIHILACDSAGVANAHAAIAACAFVCCSAARCFQAISLV
jgi:hypothetical protein